MNEHYFTHKPSSQSQETVIDYFCFSEKFQFLSDRGVFSKTGIDFGSKLLVETIITKRNNLSGNLLDLGCGYGIIGIVLARFFLELKTTMVDINRRAIELTKKNIERNKVFVESIFESDGVFQVKESFNYVVTNPPIRAGKHVINSFFEGAFEKLYKEGELFVVIQKKQGAESAIKKIESIFGNVQVLNKQSGYKVINAKKME